MIFRKHSDNFQQLESYKERNLYYKFLGGYYFNELVPGYEERKKGFNQLLKQQIAAGKLYGPQEMAMEVVSDLQDTKWDITFDYHLAQVPWKFKTEDKGEMSDVLLLAGNSFISFECKFLSDFSIKKDIVQVQGRMGEFADQFFLKPLQVLLIKTEKWKNARQARPKLELESSRLRIPLIVLFWENFLPGFDPDHPARNYLVSQLGRNKEPID